MYNLFEELRKSADKLGSCDPLWLKQEVEPKIDSVEFAKEGPIVLLLHGLFGALSNWDGIIPHITKFCRPIALHFPILTAHKTEVKIKALALLTEFYIRKNNLKNVILCGNSLGGHVALRLALTSPDLVDSMILSGSSGLYEHTTESMPLRPDEVFVRDQMNKVFINKQFITNESVAEMVSILRPRRNVLSLINVAKSAKKDNLKKLLPQIKIPTLLLWGEDDLVTTMTVAKLFNKYLPNSRLSSVKDCGHAPMIEHPEWFSNEMHEFLKDNSKLFKTT